VERALRDVMHLISAYPLETEETIPRHAMFQLWTMYALPSHTMGFSGNVDRKPGRNIG